jgi:hypothetical protein
METKKCSKCNELKPLDQFGIQKASKWVKTERPKSRCKLCENKGVKQSRSKIKKTDPERHRAKQKRVIEYNKSLSLRNLAFVFRYLKLYGKCVDCGNTDNRVLEFDHVIGEKKSGIINLAGNLSSIQTIKDEIRKCEIRCCNCHRIKTQIQLGWRNEWSDNWLNEEVD